MKFNTVTATTSISLLFYSIQNVVASQSQFKADNIRPGRGSAKKESRMKVRPSPPSSSASLRLEGAKPSALDERYQEEQHNIDYVASDSDVETDLDHTYTLRIEAELTLAEDEDGEPIIDKCIAWKNGIDSNFTWSEYAIQDVGDDHVGFTVGPTNATLVAEPNKEVNLFTYEDFQPHRTRDFFVNFDESFSRRYVLDYSPLQVFTRQVAIPNPSMMESWTMDEALRCSTDPDKADEFDATPLVPIYTMVVTRQPLMMSSAVIPSGKFMSIATTAVVLVSAFL